MKLEQQVTSLKLSKKLKELGVKQESLFWWARPTNDFGKPEGKYFVDYIETKCNDEECDHQHVSAFTVAELGEMLPKKIFANEQQWDLKMSYDNVLDNGFDIWYENTLSKIRFDTTFVDKTEANARAKMLIYLIENNFLK